MPGSFLGELAAVAGFGPLNLRNLHPASTTTAPFTALPPAPKPETPRATDSTADVVFLPPPTAKTTETYQASPFDALPEFGAFQPFDFGPLVAYNPSSAVLPALPTPTPTNGDTSFEIALPAPSIPVSPDNSLDPLSEPTSPPPHMSLLGENLPPTASNDSYSIKHDRQLVVTAANGLLANDSDPEGDTMGAMVEIKPANGDLEFKGTTGTGAGSFTYLPKSGFVDTDTFTYRVFDASGLGNTATVTINVTNALPTATADTYSTNEDQRLEVGGGGGGLPGGGGGVGVVTNDTDTDSDILRTTLVSNVTNGLLVLNDDGTFIYTPNPNFSGVDTFQYSATDGIAGTNPATVTITVQPRTSADLDGQDATTSGGWMPETDELEYGLGVGVNSSGHIMARTPVAPAGLGWSMTERKLMWDSTALAVGGVTTPGYLDLSFTGDQVKTVTAVYAGYGGTTITYQETWHNTLGQSYSSMVLLQVVPEKSPLTSVEFTSDHNVLLDNTLNAQTEGVRYQDVEWVRASKYNAPISHTRSSATVDSKLKLTLKFSVVDLANKNVKVKGTSDEAGLNFESATFNVPANGDVTLQLTATNNIGGSLRIIQDMIKWELFVEPNGANRLVKLGLSGSHKIYVTYGTPKTVAGNAGAITQPTKIRMDQAVGLFKDAFQNARERTLPAPTTEPKPQRIVYEAVQLHVFNLNVGLIMEKADYAWLVYSYGKIPNPAQAGSDCISGATFTKYASLMMGMPGTIDAKKYTAESETDPTVAVEFPGDNDKRFRTVNDKRQILALLDNAITPRFNRFEAAVVYSTDNKTFYFPVGAGAWSVDTANKVLRVMQRAAWFTDELQPVWVANVNPLYVALTAADFYSVD